MQSRTLFLQLKEELQSLVKEIAEDQCVGADLDNKLNAMRVLIRKLNEPSKARASDHIEAERLIESANTVMRKVATRFEYCFVMHHEKFGAVGADGPWSTSLKEIRDKCKLVDKSRYRVEILKRRSDTKELVGNEDNS